MIFNDIMCLSIIYILKNMIFILKIDSPFKKLHL